MICLCLCVQCVYGGGGGMCHNVYNCVCVCACACVRACVRGWVGGWVGVQVQILKSCLGVHVYSSSPLFLTSVFALVWKSNNSNKKSDHFYSAVSPRQGRAHRALQDQQNV